MRIVCISDTHGHHFQLDLPDNNILVYAGDFMTFGNEPKEIVSFNRWLGQSPHRHKVVIFLSLLSPFFDFYQGILLNCAWFIAMFDQARGTGTRW
jgi:hypothetical protein